MAEIVCPHCHSTVPRDGRFCPSCRSFIGSGAKNAEQRVPAAVSEGSASVATDTATDVVEEAVKASMAPSPVSSSPASQKSQGSSSWDVLEELSSDRPGDVDDPYPAETEVIRRSTPAEPGRKRSGGTGSARKRPQERAREVPPVARLVAWLVALPQRLRTTGRALGTLPVAVFVVVLALLGSGGLLYAVGAFDEGRAEPGQQAAVRALAPASYKPSCSAGPSTTAAGKKVTFGADHLVDGKTTTAWRCEGDGSKQRVTLRFAEPVQVTKVALVPGWATKDKTSKADRFAENGAPTAVTWKFDDTSVKQQIGKPRPEWAELALDSPVESKTVTLVVDTVREGNRRAMVAISEIRVFGR